MLERQIKHREATQWFKNGDHPSDDCVPVVADNQTFDSEGRVVRYFRHPDVSGATPCRHCDKTMHVHGWIDTLEGGHIVCPGDWIITGVQGELYPCKPDIFEATYETTVHDVRKHVIDDSPARTVVFAFHHPTVGDDFFSPMIMTAMRDLYAEDPRAQLMAYTASNGVNIKITSYFGEASKPASVREDG